MQIAHLLPYTAHYPIKKHNGRYEWALRLALFQASRGHQVTIFCAPGSGDGMPQITWRSIDSDTGNRDSNNKALIKSAFQDESFDIFHSHFDILHFELAAQTKKPIVVTQHWFPTEDIANAYKSYKPENVYLVTPTQFMAVENERLGLLTKSVIHHGIDLSVFTPVNGKFDRLIFVGRISPRKGVKEAVKLARQAGEELDIVGKTNAADQTYWQTILPSVDGKNINYLGAKSQIEVAELLANAKALLFPMQEREAFGQVLIEAQACGTPVILHNLGASNELIDPGNTGFLASTDEEFLQAIEQIPTLNRQDCREFAEKFDIRTMFNQYEKLYDQLISEH